MNSSRSDVMPNSEIADRSDHASMISGTVLSMDGHGLSDAEVELHDPTGSVIKSVYTDLHGMFSMSGVAYGNYDIVVLKGISQARQRLSVAPGDNQVTVRMPMRMAASDGSSTVSVASMRVPEKAHKLYQKAEKLMNKNKLADSRKVVEEALKVEPKYAEALTLRGILEMNDSEVSQAMNDFDAAIKADPNYALAYTTMGAAFNQTGRYKDADRVLRRAMQLRPDAWQSYFEMAKCSLGQGNYKEALEYVSKAGEISQQYPPIHLVRAHALLGMKLYQQAIGELELYLDREPTGRAADAARETLASAQAFVSTAQK